MQFSTRLTFSFITVFAFVCNIKASHPPHASSKGSARIETRDGTSHTIYTHHPTNSTMDFVKNSGVCETTPGVDQYSGYFSVGQNMSMFFWFFSARHNPHTAPLALWVNGGPGCSSMIGLFQEHGPCHFLPNASLPSLNPYSWNEYANMLYVDEPVGTGYSYGDESKVNSTVGAAGYVWSFLQSFLEQFREFEGREFGLFTESYGGHYGPEFADYFQGQNKKINDGELDAEEIDLVALGVNNGWFDSTIQEREFISFSVNNSYYALANESWADQYMTAYTTTCLPALLTCTSDTPPPRTKNSTIDPCVAAYTACSEVDSFYTTPYPSNFSWYDIRQLPSTTGFTSFPPSTYNTYLKDPEVMRRVGARGEFKECSDSVGDAFGGTADVVRSFLPALQRVVDSRIKVLIWAGDADAVCDWFGNFAIVNSLTPSATSYHSNTTFSNMPIKDYTFNGTTKGTFKTLGNLSWLRVYEAGHMVMAFQPELSSQVFEQMMGISGIKQEKGRGKGNKMGIWST